MKITIHTLAGDDSGGTWAEAHATEREAEDALIADHLGETRESFAEWCEEEDCDPADSLWEFVDAHKSDPSLDTYQLDETTVDVPLTLQPLPKSDSERVAEAIECLQRARDLLKAARCDRSLARVRLALSSAKGAQRNVSCRESTAALNSRNEEAEKLRSDALELDTGMDPGLVRELHAAADALEGKIPADFPVQPIEFMSDAYHEARARDAIAQCGTCNRMWDDAEPTSYTPAPSGRCPFEAFHNEGE